MRVGDEANLFWLLEFCMHTTEMHSSTYVDRVQSTISVITVPLAVTIDPPTTRFVDNRPPNTSSAPAFRNASFALDSDKAISEMARTADLTTISLLDPNMDTRPSNAPALRAASLFLWSLATSVSSARTAYSCSKKLDVYKNLTTIGSLSLRRTCSCIRRLLKPSAATRRSSWHWTSVDLVVFNTSKMLANPTSCTTACTAVSSLHSFASTSVVEPTTSGVDTSSDSTCTSRSTPP
mmetsp:Transcript_9225/g.29385  ORF Transcript_9225/g.29385 Transcript_9225/m.29385 type:complete len:236 (-) Transcript_9225:3-710(-)